MKGISKAINRRAAYIFVLPWIIGFAVFSAYPFFYSLYLSFFDVTITAEGLDNAFIGIENYREALSVDVIFIRDAGEFTIRSLVTVPLIVIIALVIALMLNRPLRARGIFRTIFFLPVIILSGPVINRLADIGATTFDRLYRFSFYMWLLVNENVFTGSLLFVLDNIIILLWFSGVQILVFIAGLQKIDRQAVEAAWVDGASGWEVFWKITLPALSSMILINIVFTTVMYAQSTLNPVIERVSYHMFRVQTGFGYSSALAWLYFLLITVLMLVLVGIFAVFSRKSG
jgi:ABC-type sugar transport system permease subunit